MAYVVLIDSKPYSEQIFLTLGEAINWCRSDCCNFNAQWDIFELKYLVGSNTMLG